MNFLLTVLPPRYLERKNLLTQLTERQLLRRVISLCIEKYVNEQDKRQNDVSAESDEQIYQIEKILKKHTHRGQTQYLVKWLEYPSEQSSWVSECDMLSPETTDQQIIVNA